MASRKHTRADVKRIHTQTEINRRLHRAERLAECMYYESISSNSLTAELCLSSVLSYLADDLQEVHRLFNGKTHTE
ncbi:derepression protein [Salmonella enterica]|nr:derepression protein [Salmonella enterica]